MPIILTVPTVGHIHVYVLSTYVYNWPSIMLCAGKDRHQMHASISVAHIASAN